MSQDFGLDRSGNTNHWAVNNMTYPDQMLDTPTNNFCTVNPLSKQNYTFAEGNLKLSRGSGTGQSTTIGTMSVSSGKWYWEVKLVSGQSNYPRIGIFNTAIGDNHIETNYPAAASSLGARVWGSGASGAVNSIFGNGNISASFGSYDDGDVLQFALDMDNLKMYMGKNDTWYTNSASTTAKANISDSSANAAFDAVSNLDIVAGDSFTPCIFANASGEIWVANFGQDSSFAGEETAQGNQDGNDIGDFYYTPPTDYLALCTSNLPAVAVVPSEHFNTVLWSGDGASDRAITGLDFQPDFVWAKNRGYGHHHGLFDSIRGATNILFSDATLAEGDYNSSLTAFNSNGFQIGNDGAMNNSSYTYVAWNWKANGSGSANGEGSITTTATSANTDAGFSIVSYTGNDTNGATLGHGLDSTPQLIITKRRDGDAISWYVYNETIGNTKYLKLDDTLAETTSLIWNNTSPTATLFSVSDGEGINSSSNAYIAYCFHSVDGYSKVGSYEGNGDNDGTFIYLGFRPAYVMIKNTADTDNWYVADSEREDGEDGTASTSGNPMTQILNPNLAGAEYTTGSNKIDFTSNGIKCRDSASGDTNINGELYIYIAFAETPFKYSNAR